MVIIIVVVVIVVGISNGYDSNILMPEHCYYHYYGYYYCQVLQLMQMSPVLEFWVSLTTDTPGWSPLVCS